MHLSSPSGILALCDPGTTSRHPFDMVASSTARRMVRCCLAPCFHDLFSRVKEEREIRTDDSCIGYGVDVSVEPSRMGELVLSMNEASSVLLFLSSREVDQLTLIFSYPHRRSHQSPSQSNHATELPPTLTLKRCISSPANSSSIPTI
jgi:hypothetical protein